MQMFGQYSKNPGNNPAPSQDNSPVAIAVDVLGRLVSAAIAGAVGIISSATGIPNMISMLQYNATIGAMTSGNLINAQCDPYGNLKVNPGNPTAVPVVNNITAITASGKIALAASSNLQVNPDFINNSAQTMYLGVGAAFNETNGGIPVGANGGIYRFPAAPDNTDIYAAPVSTASTNGSLLVVLGT